MSLRTSRLPGRKGERARREESERWIEARRREERRTFEVSERSVRADGRASSTDTGGAGNLVVAL